MDNSINGINFKANLKTGFNVKIKDRAKFNNVVELFKQGTKDSSLTMYITKTPYNTYSWHISDIKSGDFYKGAELITDSVNEHLNELTEKQFAKKLIGAFRVMKLQQNIYPKIENLHKEIKRLTDVFLTNKQHAAACRANNKAKQAEVFENLAKRNEARLQSLNNEFENTKGAFEKTKEQYSKDFPEIGQIDLYTILI
jgi:hypothetical protein